MADVIRYERFWQRRDTAANWTAVNPVLADGEIGYETDTAKWKFGDGVTAWNSLVYKIDEAPIDGQDYVRRDGAWEVASGSGGSGQLDASTTVYESWDFISTGVVASTSTGINFSTNGSVPVVYTAGTSAGASLTSAAGSPGICTLTTGTTSSGYARLFLCPPLINLGGGEAHYRVRIRIPTLSTVSERFSIVVSMANVISGAPQRIGAVYIDNSNSGQWTADAIGVGTTTTNTTVAPVANTWTKLELRVNAAGTSYQLFIDGTTAATVASNIPTAALGLGVQITKTVGSTARTVDVDFGEFVQTLTTAR